MTPNLKLGGWERRGPLLGPVHNRYPEVPSSNRLETDPCTGHDSDGIRCALNEPSFDSTPPNSDRRWPNSSFGSKSAAKLSHSLDGERAFDPLSWVCEAGDRNRALTYSLRGIAALALC